MANHSPPPAMADDDFGPSDQLRADEVALILAAYEPRNSHDDTRIVLQAFVDNLPLNGHRAIISDILSRKTDGSELRKLRNFAVDTVLKPLKTARGRGLISTAISKSSCPEVAGEIDDLAKVLEPSTRHGQPAIKAMCLRRDGFRCPVSGIYHEDSVLEGHVHIPDGGVISRTECAHIIPFSLRDFERTQTRELNNKATIWYALYRYFPCLRGAIGPGTINQGQNVITMSLEAHDNFGRFQFALDAVPGTNNQYHVTPISETARIRSLPFPVNRVISLASNDPAARPPSPGFLDTHARVARILEVSGIGGKIARLMEPSYVERIAPDGSTDLGSILARQLLTDI